VFKRDEEADLSEPDEDEDLLTRAIDDELYNRDFQDLSLKSLQNAMLLSCKSLPSAIRIFSKRYSEISRRSLAKWQV